MKTPLVFLLVLFAPTWIHAAELQAWQAFAAGDAFILMRHAYAPGVGDPAHFVLNDCDTQRNLNEEGKEQARAWGQLLRSKNLDHLKLYSSSWCRSIETAELMEAGPVTRLPVLDSFFQNRSTDSVQTEGLRVFLRSLVNSESAVLVTHQVNITALTGIFPGSGEALIIALPLENPPVILARVPVPGS